LPGMKAIKPLRVVLDARLLLSPRSRLGVTAADYPSLVLTSPNAPGERAKELEAVGFEIIRIECDGAGRLDLVAALRFLAERGVARVFSEGGPTIAAAAIAQGLADDVILFTAQKPLGRPGLPALDATALTTLEDRNRYSPPRIARFGADEMRLYERRL